VRSAGRSSLPTTVAEERKLIRQVYDRLLAAYGPQGWWPGDDSAFTVVVGAILTQSAAWANVEKALANLETAGALSPRGLLALPEQELARLVRPSGYYNAKARKLRAFAEMLAADFAASLDRLFSLPLDALRARLLATHGIGPETADDIILYAARRPVFVVDAYTRRVFSRLGLRPERGAYNDWQALFTSALPRDVTIFNEYHALLVRHAKVSCRKLPLCDACCLAELCPAPRSSPASSSLR
jgi:endonuclease-3 related protein